jgi:hypothetical protein
MVRGMAEKRLIDANALIRRICTERDEVEIKTGFDIGYHNGLNMGASMTINAPTVDAVEVVRCKDCKYWWKESETCTHPLCCESWMCVMQAPIHHYCSYGEKRGDSQ